MKKRLQVILLLSLILLLINFIIFCFSKQTETTDYSRNGEMVLDQSDLHLPDNITK